MPATRGAKAIATYFLALATGNTLASSIVYKSSKKGGASEPSCLSGPPPVPQTVASAPAPAPIQCTYITICIRANLRHAQATPMLLLHQVQLPLRNAQHTPAPAPSTAPYGCSASATLIAVVFLTKRAMSQNFTSCTLSCGHGASFARVRGRSCVARFQVQP